MKDTIDIEAQQGMNLAKAAAKTPSLKHYIWSTLPDNIKISDGKFSVPHFESKVKVDKFIKADKDLLMKTTFLWMTYYSNNIAMPLMAPSLFVSISPCLFYFLFIYLFFLFEIGASC